MFRQTAFGIALSTLVLGSGLTTIPVPGHTSTNKGVAESGDDSTKFSTISQWFRTLIHPALMQRPNKNSDPKPNSTVSHLFAKSTNFHAITIEKSVFEQINRYRVQRGLQKLTLNRKISRQARYHSQNMALEKVPFSHQGFKQRVSVIPIPYNSAAENVAYNQGYQDPAAQAMEGWLNSRGHLKNIQGNFNLTGIGVAINDRGQVYITQLFLRTQRTK